MTTEEPGEDHLQQRGNMKLLTGTILMALDLNLAPAANLSFTIARSPLPVAFISHTSPLSQPFPMKSYL